MHKLFTSLFLLLFTVMAFSQSMVSVSNRDEIIKRLAKTCHPDNLALVSFSDSESKERIKNLRVEIKEIEPKPDKMDEVFCKNVPVVSSTSGLDGPVTNFNLDNSGAVRFQIKKGKDYLISTSITGYEEKQLLINWLELLQNNELGILLKKTECKYINGMLTLKKVQLNTNDIKIRVLCKTDKRSNVISINSFGQFIIPCEINKEYSLEVYEKENLQQSLEIPIMKKNQGIGDLQIRTNDFDIILQDEKLNKSVFKTMLLQKDTSSISLLSEQYIKDHFLNKKATQFSGGMIFQLSNYYYDYENLSFSEESKREFELLARLMVENPKMKVSINVHTDKVGTVAFCQRFSYDIAEKISRFLISKGVDKSHILARGMGSAFQSNNPVSSDASKLEKMISGRRTEVEVLDF